MHNFSFKILVLAAFAMAMTTSAKAQTDVMAPGFEKLNADWQPFARVPLVLTPVSAPEKCLDLSLNDKTAKTLIIWDCAITWNQKVWYDNLSFDGAKDKVRVRIGKLACLNSSTQAGGRASMNICGDAPSAESFAFKDGLLIDGAGFCLTFSAPVNGANLSFERCDGNEVRQKWKLDSMRAARSRHKAVSSYDPSGLNNIYVLGHLPDVVEELRPRFTNRALSDTERNELKSLTASWRRINVVDVIRDSKLKGPEFIPWSNLKRLSELGESGDKEAMRAVMEAFVLSYRASSTYNSAGAWVEIGFEPNAFPHAENGAFARRVVKALGELWGAHYWQRHGADPIAGRSFTVCYSPSPFECKGYKGNVSGDLIMFVRGEKIKTQPSITNITFSPTAGTPEEREGRFLAYMGGPTHYWQTTDPWHELHLVQQAVYAQKTGRFALWDSTRLNTVLGTRAWQSNQELFMRQTLAARAEASTLRANEMAWRDKFNAFMAKPSPTLYERGQIEAELVMRGETTDSELLRYAEKHTVSAYELVPRLCGSGREQTITCRRAQYELAQRIEQNLRDLAERRRVENAARERAEAIAKAKNEEAYRRYLAEQALNKKPSFADSLVSLAEGFAAAAEAGNQQVTVRKYDTAGNYVGSETMTRSRAAGYGATPTK